MRIRLALLALGSTVIGACSAPTEPAAVTLEVELVNATTPTVEVEYRFAIRNGGTATIYLPACDGETEPTFHIVGPGTDRDRISHICPANVSMSPLALGPGDRYEGRGRLARRAGGRFTPSINYARAVGDLPALRATAPAFDSP